MKLESMVVRFVVVAVAAVAGCSKSDKQAPAAQQGSAGVVGARPASVTAEMADTFEAYASAFEKLTADIEQAGSDCKAILAVVQKDTKDITALAPRGDKLREAMLSAKGDPAAGEWFATTYVPRMKTASEKLKPLETTCAQDAQLKAALNDAMGQFPMLRKKP